MGWREVFGHGRDRGVQGAEPPWKQKYYDGEWLGCENVSILFRIVRRLIACFCLFSLPFASQVLRFPWVVLDLVLNDIVIKELVKLPRKLKPRLRCRELVDKSNVHRNDQQIDSHNHYLLRPTWDSVTHRCVLRPQSCTTGSRHNRLGYNDIAHP